MKKETEGEHAYIRDKINGMSKIMGDMSGMMKQMSERMKMGTKKPQ